MSEEHNLQQAADILLEVDSHAASPLADVRTPPPDILGHLADLGIHRHHIREIGEHIQRNWPDVALLESGLKNRQTPYFAVRLVRYTEALADKNWALARWIQKKYPSTTAAFFYVLPTPSAPELPASATLYVRRTIDEPRSSEDIQPSLSESQLPCPE